MITCCVLLSALLVPQEPEVGPSSVNDPLTFEQVPSGGRVRVDTVDGVERVSVWLTLRAGSDHDPGGATGLARVIAEVLRAELPPSGPQRPAEVSVSNGATMVGVLLAADEVEGHLDRVARWLRGELELGDDEIVKARGRALLRADDEAEILPGPLLRERAERVLLPGTPTARLGGGAPAEVRALTPAAVRDGFRRAFHPSRATLVLLGSVTADDVLPAARAALAAGREVASLPAVAVAPEGEAEGLAETPSDRIDAPFVTYAFPAPAWGEADYLPFLVAMEVVRARAAGTFRILRGGELRAEFPPLAYDFLRMPKTASIGRRGRDGDTVELVKAEIDSLIAGLRSGGAMPQEVQSALGVLLGTLDVPPFRSDLLATVRRYPVLLHQRGYVTSCYGLHAWPADLPMVIGSVQIGAVDRVLMRALAPARGTYVALRPGD